MNCYTNFLVRTQGQFNCIGAKLLRNVCACTHKYRYIIQYNLYSTVNIFVYCTVVYSSVRSSVNEGRQFHHPWDWWHSL